MDKTHRCDRCSAQAIHRFSQESTASDLLFCNHHAQTFMEALADQGWVIAESQLIEA